MYQVALHASAPWWNEVSSSTSIAAPSSTNYLGLDDHPGQGGAMLNLTDLDNIGEDDFLISDLSEFSNEDIAAPIHSNASQANSDSPSFSTGLPKVKSCETMATSSNMNSSIHDNGPETLCSSIVDNAHPQQQKKDGALINVLKYEDEGDFDWLNAFNEDTLIYGASRFGVTESLLLSDSLPFGCEVTKHSQLHSALEDSCKGDQNSGPSVSSNSGAANGTAGADVSAVPPLSVPTGKARSKRPRSGVRTAGGIVNWSSAACILPWKQNSPTNSMDSAISDHLDDDDKLSHRKAMSSPSHFTSFSSHSTLVDSDEGLVQQQMSSSTSLKEGLNSDHECYKGNAYYGYSGESMKGKSMGKGMLHSNQKWKKNADLEEGDYEEQPVARRCTHCLSSKTPQWRAGPLGPKTLCNACGVRFKSGRLFDEYRPAKSPTFLSYKHSNSHKKVLEMRRRKGLQSAAPTPSSSNSSSLSHSSSSTSVANAPNHAVKKLKIKLPCTTATTTTQPPHLPDIALINAPTLESPNFIY